MEHGAGTERDRRHGRRSAQGSEAHTRRDRLAGGAALVGIVAAAALAASSTTLAVLNRPPGNGAIVSALGGLLATVSWLTFCAVGALIGRRRSDNPIGWLLLGDGVVWLVGLVIERYVAVPTRSGAGYAASVLESFGWTTGLALIALVFLLYPTGREPTSRWRPVRGLVIGGAIMAGLGLVLTPGPLASFPDIRNPLGVESLSSIAARTSGLGEGALFAGVVLSLVSVVVRFRKTSGRERQQIRWLAFAAILVAIAFVVGDVVTAVGGSGAMFNVIPLSAVPVAIGIAVLRYRVWDLDIVAGRTLLYGMLVVIVSGVYALFIAGFGALIGAGAAANVWLAVVATTSAAVILQPVRESVQSVVRRVVFSEPSDGARAPLEVTVRTLGGFRVERHSVPIGPSEWQSKKARQLMKMLIAARGRPVHRERLIDALWPEDVTGNLSNRLSVAVSTIRSVLDPDRRYPSDHYVVGEDDTLRIDLAHLSVDVERFLEAASRAVKGSEVGAAIDLYGGDFLEEDLYADWAQPLREEARAGYMALLRRAVRDVDRSDVDATVSALLRVLEVDPWDEPSHLDLIEVLSASGRHGEARRARRRYEARMEEVGLPVGTD